jgi:uncharacterized Zn-finger protein
MAHICLICQKTCTSKFNLERHIKSTHGGIQASYQCFKCDKKFNREDNLRLHEQKCITIVIKGKFCDLECLTETSLSKHTTATHQNIYIVVTVVVLGSPV